MALYREHSGGLMESHDTVITGECLDDIMRTLTVMRSRTSIMMKGQKR